MDEVHKAYLHAAMVYVQGASSQVSCSNNCVEDVPEIPKELKDEMIQVCSTLHSISDRLLEILKKG